MSNLKKQLHVSEEATSEEEYAHEVTKRYVGESGFMLFGEIDHASNKNSNAGVDVQLVDRI